MRSQHHRNFAGRLSSEGGLLALLAVFVSGGCSLINSFDDIVTEPSDPGDGDGAGGSDMGGANSGGSDGMGGDGNTGNTGNGGNGTGGAEVVEPGLVIAIEKGGPFGPEEDILHALSPHDGKEFATDNANYYSAVHEPNRDVWFFVRDGMLVGGSFDLVEREWTFHSVTGPELIDNTADFPSFVQEFFAFNEIVVIGLGDKLHAYDTADLSAIAKIGEADYPEGTFLWGMAAAPKAVGGSINILKKNCVDDLNGPCDIELTTFSVTQDEISPVGTIDVLADFDVVGFATARGNMHYDHGTAQSLVVVPSKDTLGQMFAFNPHDPDPPGAPTANYAQPGSRISKLAIDPCFSVAYLMDTLSEDLIGVPFVDDAALPLNEDLASPGTGLVYEPYTRSLISFVSEDADFGVVAHQLTGTPSAPDIRKRIIDWSPPLFKPSFLAVASTDKLLCSAAE